MKGHGAIVVVMDDDTILTNIGAEHEVQVSHRRIT
jgi:hypothetical protein